MLRLLLALLLLLAGGCARAPQANGDLLRGRAPERAVHADGAGKLTDGVVDTRGDDWRSASATVLRSTQAYVQYDLGKRVALDAAYVQGDANDTYVVSASDDGVHFTPLWRAGPVSETGLSPRWATGLGGHGRYIRLGAEGGDGLYSATELAVYERAPAVFPPRFRVATSAPPPELLRSATLLLGVSLVLFLLLAMEGAPWWWTALATLLPVAAGVRWATALSAAWPVAPREVSLVRGVVAAVAAVAVVREALAARHWRPDRRAVVGVLGVCAALAAASFANLGRAQFVDHEHGGPGYVHNFDMRVYYPVAKYFRELRFDGLYEASVAAYVDDDPYVSVETLGNTSLRDLRTHAMVHVSDVAPRIAAVKQRFSPGRWREFVTDMRYFRRNMGTRDYLGSMGDHGGNATPAWFAIAHVLFAFTHASNGTLLATGMLDPLLLALAFFAIARTFGVRTMLVALVVFGANDFYMFGTDWFGATLRHDWMAYLALGACALHTKRFKLGGGLLALAAMMRAFPLLALVGASIPALAWLGRETWRRRALPRWAEIRREQRATLQMASGALVVAFGMLAFSSLLFGPGAWLGWLHKVHMLDASPHVNHVSLRGLIAGSDGIQARLLAERMPIFIAGVAAFVVLVVAAAYRRPLHQAALLGLPLVPVLFNPANYYSHLVFLYPLLVAEIRIPGQAPVTRRDAGLWVLLLGLCAAQYGTVLVTDLGLHFYLATALLFVMLATLLVVLAANPPEAAVALLAVPGSAPAAAPATDVPDSLAALGGLEPITETSGSAGPDAAG